MSSAANKRAEVKSRKISAAASRKNSGDAPLMSCLPSASDAWCHCHRFISFRFAVVSAVSLFLFDWRAIKLSRRWSRDFQFCSSSPVALASVLLPPRGWKLKAAQRGAGQVDRPVGRMAPSVNYSGGWCGCRTRRPRPPTPESASRHKRWIISRMLLASLRTGRWALRRKWRWRPSNFQNAPKLDSIESMAHNKISRFGEFGEVGEVGEVGEARNKENLSLVLMLQR